MNEIMVQGISAELFSDLLRCRFINLVCSYMTGVAPQNTIKEFMAVKHAEVIAGFPEIHSRKL